MRTRAVLVATGVLVMAGAVAGALTDPDVPVGGVLLFLAAVLAGHDLIVMSVVLAAGAVLTRFVPPHRRTVARAAAISAAAVVVVAAPLVLGFGRDAGNPSVLPLPYPRNLAVVLLLIAAVALLIGRRPGRRKKSERPRAGGTPPGAR